MSGKARYADLLSWALAGLLAAAVVIWAFPRVFPFLAGGWRLHSGEAAELALEGFRELGEPVDNPYVVVILEHDEGLGRRLRRAAHGGAGEAVAASRLARGLRHWHVFVYPPAAEPEDWAYHGVVSLGGEVLQLEHGMEPPQQEKGEIEPAAVRSRADEVLRRLGFDPAAFEAPTLRRRERPEAIRAVLRYRDRETLLDTDFAYGVEVELAGDRLTKLHTWRDHSGDEGFLSDLRRMRSVAQIRFWAPHLLFAFVAVPFLRRYHEGRAEVRRGLRILLLLLACGAVLTALAARGASTGEDPDISRPQTTWVWGLKILVVWLAPMALTAALAWTVGETRCRERWGSKLAGFDAVLHGRFNTATVARAALRGPVAGLAVAAGLLLLLVLGQRLGLEPVAGSILGLFYESSPWPGAALLFLFAVYGTFAVLTSLLFLLPPAVERLGRWPGGVAVALLSALLFFPPLTTLPAGSGLLLSALAAAMAVVLFLRCDLLTAMLADITLHAVLASLPYLFADDAWLNFQGILPLTVLCLPLALSWRALGRGEEAVYRWQEVPPNVRRIAERERRQLELRTARRIQSSILPPLPASIDGVELAHAYRPATEVGGDFYEVAELADGRLALAVGDVAGHGVASGLVMAMARSALALQTTIDPAVEAVFATLNRVLHDTARKSLMTTLCYGVLDPRRRELTFASAGHLFPYVVEAGGAVRWLESVAYPLGVRRQLAIRPSRVRLAAGDTLVLVSDGVVEATPQGTDEPFGFERLEQCLCRCAAAAPTDLRDEVLADLACFAGSGPRRDDQTILVARLP